MIERGPRTLRVPRGRTAGILALGGLGLVLVLVASASGPVDFVTAPRSSATRTPSTATPSLMTLTRPRSSGGTGVPANFDPPALPSFVRPLLQVLVWAAILLVLVLLVRGLWRHVPRWRSRQLAQRDVAFLPDVPEELTRSADARMALLGQGSPRNAIVACWLDLEEAAAKVGLPRGRAETSRSTPPASSRPGTSHRTPSPASRHSIGRPGSPGTTSPRSTGPRPSAG